MAVSKKPDSIYLVTCCLSETQTLGSKEICKKALSPLTLPDAHNTSGKEAQLAFG